MGQAAVFPFVFKARSKFQQNLPVQLLVKAREERLIQRAKRVADRCEA